VSNSFDHFWSKEKPTARSLLAVGSVNFAYESFTSSDPVLQKTRNSCRRTCACRCNSCGLLDEDLHENG